MVRQGRAVTVRTGSYGAVRFGSVRRLWCGGVWFDMSDEVGRLGRGSAGPGQAVMNGGSGDVWSGEAVGVRKGEV